MATNLATAYVAVVPSMEGVQGQLMRGMVPAVGNASDKAGREGGKRMGNAFTSSLKKFAAVGAASLGLGAIVGGMKAAITEAGNLEQSVGSVAVVFGKNMGQMDAWARKSAQTLGLSRNEYNEFATLIGSQLKNAGIAMQDLGPETNKLITLGADLASMYGGTTADAVQALSSTLKGEMDPIQGYGVTLTAAAVEAEAAAMGFEKVGDSFSTEAKAAATMNLIMDQTTDAHNMFANEANTYAGQVARLSAGWKDLSAKVGTLFLPVMTGVVSFFTGSVLPALSEVAGGVQAFRSAWTAADGDITSSGFPGFMERAAFVARDVASVIGDVLGPVVRGLADWLRENSTMIGSVVAVLATMTAGFYANTAAVAAASLATAGYTTIVGGLRSRLLTARIAVMYFNAALLANPIGLVVAALAGLVTAIVLAWKHSETFRSIVTAVWNGIKAAVSAVGDWFMRTLFPAIQTGITKTGEVISWLKTNVVEPVWYGIRVAVAAVGAILLTIWDGLAWAVRNTLGKVLQWLLSDVVKPVWEAIRVAISAAWTFIRDKIFTPLRDFVTKTIPDAFRFLLRVVRDVWEAVRNVISAAWSFVRENVFRPIVAFLERTLGPAFRFLYDHVIRPVWDNVKRVLGDGWAWIRDHVLKPFAGFIDGTIGQAFRRGVDGIKSVWDSLKKAVSDPVEAVINTVVNDGFIRNFNKIARKFGIRTLDEVNFRGFREGGRTGGVDPDEVRGVVHGREFVLNERRTEELDRMAPGFLDDFHARGAAAFRDLVNPAHMAVGSAVYGGRGSFANPLQHAIARSGVLNVAGHAPGWGLSSAVGMLDRATAIKVRQGGGYPRVNVNAGHYPAWWAGYYQGNSVMLNDAVMGNSSPTAKRTVAAHELGHALGLPHSDPSGLQSIMSYANMYRHNSVTPADVAALSAIYGGSGKAGGGSSPEDEKRGIVQRIIDGLLKVIGFDGLLGKIPGGEFMVELMKGAARNVWDSFKSWTKKMVESVSLKDLLGIGDGKGLFAPGPDGDQRPTVFDGGGWLEKSAEPQLTWHRERKPDAVLTNEDYHLLRAAAMGDGRGDGREAPVVENLYAVDMDEALRKLRAEEQKKEALFR